jgi:hypothetical protein
VGKEPTEKLLVRETTSLLKSQKLLQTNPDEMSDEENLFAWSVLDLIDKGVLSVRKEQLRQKLFSLAETKGKLTSKGHYEYQPEFSDGSICKQRKSGRTSLDTVRLLEKLMEIGFDIDKLLTRTFDEKLVEAYVATGDIPLSIIKDCTSIGEPTYALQVNKPSEVLALMPKTLKGKKDD